MPTSSPTSSPTSQAEATASTASTSRGQPAAAEVAQRRRRRRLKVPGPLAGPARWRKAALGLAAAILLGLSLAILAGAVAERTARIALAAGPPPPLAPFEEALALGPGPAEEIALLAQLDRPRAYFVRHGAGEAFVAPLYAEARPRPNREVRAVLFSPTGEPPEAALAKWVRQAGPAGTVIALRGQRARPDARLRARVARAFAAEGLAVAPNALFVKPYLEPRRRALTPGPAALVFGGLVMAAGALLGLFAAIGKPRG